MPSSGLLLAAMVETGLVTWRDLSKTKILPPPSDYVAIAIIYGGLSLFPESGARFASLVGWGFVVATLLNFWSPGNWKNISGNGTANTPGNPYSLTDRGTGPARPQ